MGHFHGGIKGLEPGAAFPGLLAGFLAEAFKAESAAMEHQLKPSVAPTRDFQQGIAHGSFDQSFYNGRDPSPCHRSGSVRGVFVWIQPGQARFAGGSCRIDTQIQASLAW